MAMFIILKTDNFNFGFFLKVSCAFLLLENKSYQNFKPRQLQYLPHYCLDKGSCESDIASFAWRVT